MINVLSAMDSYTYLQMGMIDPTFIKHPILTDKTTKLLENNKYTFKVDSRAHKVFIKRIVESLFSVKVVKVNTCYLSKKKKRVGKYLGWKPKYKKAIITLSKGDVINLFNDN